MKNFKKTISLIVTFSLILGGLNGCGKGKWDLVERDSGIGLARQERQETPKTNEQTPQRLQIEDAEKSERLQTYSLHQNVVPVNFRETDSKDIQVDDISPLGDCSANVVRETSIKPTAGQIRTSKEAFRFSQIGNKVPFFHGNVLEKLKKANEKDTLEDKRDDMRKASGDSFTSDNKDSQSSVAIENDLQSSSGKKDNAKEEETTCKNFNLGWAKGKGYEKTETGETQNEGQQIKEGTKDGENQKGAQGKQRIEWQKPMSLYKKITTMITCLLCFLHLISCTCDKKNVQENLRPTQTTTGAPSMGKAEEDARKKQAKKEQDEQDMKNDALAYRYSQKSGDEVIEYYYDVKSQCYEEHPGATGKQKDDGLLEFDCTPSYCYSDYYNDETHISNGRYDLIHFPDPMVAPNPEFDSNIPDPDETRYYKLNINKMYYLRLQRPYKKKPPFWKKPALHCFTDVEEYNRVFHEKLEERKTKLNEVSTNMNYIVSKEGREKTTDMSDLATYRLWHVGEKKVFYDWFFKHTGEGWKEFLSDREKVREFIRMPEWNEFLKSAMWSKYSNKEFLALFLISEDAKDWRTNTTEGKRWYMDPSLKCFGWWSYLRSDSGRAWLLTKEGREWRTNTPEGKDWFNSRNGGWEWLDTAFGRAWLIMEEGREFRNTDAGKYWMNHKFGGWEWLAFRDPISKKDRESAAFKEAMKSSSFDGERDPKPETGLEFLETEEGDVWLADPEQGWKWLAASWKDYIVDFYDHREDFGMVVMYVKNHYATYGGADFLKREAGKKFLKRKSGKTWLKFRWEDYRKWRMWDGLYVEGVPSLKPWWKFWGDEPVDDNPCGLDYENGGVKAIGRCVETNETK